MVLPAGQAPMLTGRLSTAPKTHAPQEAKQHGHLRCSSMAAQLPACPGSWQSVTHTPGTCSAACPCKPLAPDVTYSQALLVKKCSLPSRRATCLAYKALLLPTLCLNHVVQPWINLKVRLRQALVGRQCLILRQQCLEFPAAPQKSSWGPQTAGHPHYRLACISPTCASQTLS